jgi:hypothetical protein
MLKTTDGDTLFNNWYQSSDTNRDENSYLVYGPPTSTTTGTDSNGNTYNILTFGSPQPDSNTNLIGVYPAPSDTQSWMGLIGEWGGPNLRWQPDKSTKFYSPEPLPTQNDGSGLDWFNYQNTGAPRPDNFLARMGIPPDSPLVVYFCTGKYSVDGLPVDASAFLNLLEPAGDNAGGWIGYIRGRGPTTPIDELRNYIYTKVDWISAPNKPCNSGNQALNGVTAGFSSAVPGLMMIPALFTPLGWPGVIAGLLGVATMSGLSAAKAATASNC